MSERHSDSQRGSAYIIALLVLVVLSILGLSLAMITQTEAQIGANELMVHRTLYGAETGVQLAVARVLTVNSSVDNATVTAVEPMEFRVDEVRLALQPSGSPYGPDTVVEVDPGDGETHFAERIEVSPFVPIRNAFCDGCPAAEGDVQLLNVNHAVVATSRRIAWTGPDAPDAAMLDAATRTAQKRLYLMIGLQPWWPPRWEAIADPAQTSQVTQQTLGMFAGESM